MVDDHSTDDSIELVKDWGRRTGIRYQIVIPGPKSAEWVDCGWTINAGIRATTAEHIILTHPEVMPGRASVRTAVEYLSRNPWTYFGAKTYYLSYRDQQRIDSVDWRGEGAKAIRKVDGFYDRDQHVGGNPDYTPWAIDRVGEDGYTLPSGFSGKTWESWVWGGCSRVSWKKLSGMLQTKQWGAVDVGFWERRSRVGMKTFTPTDPDAAVFHQNHSGPNDIPSPRVEDGWKQELGPILAGKSADDLLYPAVNNLGWD
jgi:hypothetical protein